ncbi:MAG: sensor domain-containing diguanylate cyclase, partial [Patescibacteria group bacterium]
MTEEQKKIKELEEEISRLKELAYQDELTALYNRHGFKEESAKFIDEVKGYLENPSRRENFLIKSLSLGIFDIDDFKKINDTYGHQAGDAILKLVSKIIKEKV